MCRRIRHVRRAHRRGGAAKPSSTTRTTPYTVGLLRSVPRLDRPRATELQSIGPAPDSHLPPGCSFAPRCWLNTDVCWRETRRPSRPVTAGGAPASITKLATGAAGAGG